VGSAALAADFYLHFNGHFPAGPGLAGTRMSPLWILQELRVMEVMVTTDIWSYTTCKASQTFTTNKSTPSFLQAGCPSCRPTNDQLAAGLCSPNAPVGYILFSTELYI